MSIKYLKPIEICAVLNISLVAVVAVSGSAIIDATCVLSLPRRGEASGRGSPLNE